MAESPMLAPCAKIERRYGVRVGKRAGFEQAGERVGQRIADRDVVHPAGGTDGHRGISRAHRQTGTGRWD